MMTHENAMSWSAFVGFRRVATGAPADVAAAAREATGEGGGPALLVFDDATGRVVDLDLRGTPEEVRGRIHTSLPAFAPAGAGAIAEESPRGPGRPKLGVVAREVTLLPRHWAWLGAQGGGASAALRRLVEEARRADAPRDQVRRAQDAAYRFMSAMAGDLPGYEEALRALFAGDQEGFNAHTADWPVDVRAHGRALAAEALTRRPAKEERAGSGGDAR